MGKTYAQGEVLTALDLNASLAEMVNTTGDFTFTGQHTHQNNVYFYTPTAYYANVVYNYANVEISTGTLNVASGTIYDRYGDVRSIKRNPTVPPGYTITTSDVGKFLYATGDVNIINGVMNIGDNITIYNSTASTIDINQVSGTMYLAGIGLTGNRTLDEKGLCTILCVDTNKYAIIGAGLN